MRYEFIGKGGKIGGNKDVIVNGWKLLRWK